MVVVVRFVLASIVFGIMCALFAYILDIQFSWKLGLFCVAVLFADKVADAVQGKPL